MKITKVLSVLACLGLALTFVACPGPNEPGVNPEVAANAEAKANKEAAANKEAKANAVALANADAAYDKLYGAEERANREEYNNELARGGNPQRPVPTKSLAKLLGDFTKEAVASDLADIKDGLVDGVNEYKVTDVAGLKKIAELVNGGEYFTDKTITQVNDIVVNNYVLMKDFSYGFESNGERADEAKSLVNLESIGQRNVSSFGGTFDGNGYTIRGLYMYQGNQGLGLFGVVNGGTIKNVTVVDAMVVNSNDSAATDGSDDDRFGGIVGITEGTATIENCTYVGIVGSPEAKANGGAYEYIGAIVGRADGVTTIKNCTAITQITGDGQPLNKKVGSSGSVAYENSFGIDYATWTVQTDAANTKVDVDLTAVAAVNPKVAALAAALK